MKMKKRSKQAQHSIMYKRLMISGGVVLLTFTLLFGLSAQSGEHPLDGLYNKLAGQGLQSAEPHAQLRRLSLQIRGVIPTAKEVAEFEGMPASTRLETFAIRFLKDPDYAHYWGILFGSMLREKMGRKDRVPEGSYFKYISKSLHDNKPYNVFVKEMLTATGNAEKNPAANFYLRDEADPLEIAEYVGRVFYGRRFSCARCHDHPFDENITRRDYYGMAAFFSQTWVKKRKDEFVPRQRIQNMSTKDKKEYERKMKDWRREVWSKMSKEQRKNYWKKSRLKYYEVHVEKKLGIRFPYSDDAPGGDIVKPKLPDGKRIIIDEDDDRREVFAKWLTNTKNARFRKVIVNRIWTRMMGWSFFTPLDDWGPKTKIQGEEILNHLEQVFLQKNYRIKDLILYIVTSQAYFRASPAPGASKVDSPIVHFQPKRLDAYQLFNSILRGTETVSIKWIGERRAYIKTGKVDLRGLGKLKAPKPGWSNQLTNACEVRAPMHKGSFLSVFGAGDRQNVDDDNNSLSIDQILTLLNGNVANQLTNKYAKKESRILRDYEKHKNMIRSMNEVYMYLLSRPMTPEEMKQMERFSKSKLAGRGRWFQRGLLQDLAWSVINSQEFIHVY